MDDSLPTWSIRPYQAGDEAPLVALFAQVFGRPIGLEGWRWKLKGQPAPVENVWVAVAADGRVIGQYAGIPVRVQWDGTVRPAMISVDTMTAPDFRRRGILTTLGQAIYASWAAAGVSAVLGLPNQQWGSRTDALGWTTLFPLAWRRAPLHVERALAARAPRLLSGAVAGLGGAGLGAWRRLSRGGQGQLATRGGARRLRVEAVAGATPDFDQLWTRLAGAYDHLLVRDGAWVTWRYLQAPGFDYRVLLAYAESEPVGYVAYRLDEAQGRRTGYLADLFVAPADTATARALLGAMLDDLWAGGAETARALAVPGAPLDRTLQAAGLRPAAGAFNFELVPLPTGPDPAVLRDRGGWLLAGGDFDVV